MNYWLVKSDPETYSWDDMKNENTTIWTGVRNYQARNNLKAMKKGDLVLFYHSQSDKSIVGITKVVKEYYPDPTSDDNKNWVAVDLQYYSDLIKPISLDEIKNNPKLSNIALIKQSRLSVMPLTKEEYEEITKNNNKIN
jgi:predicted RNA-binding protein with PUA-like domain